MPRRDPYRNYKFEVEVGGFLRAGFSKVSGIKVTTEVIEYREGGENETPRKLPGQTKFENVVLERGLSDDPDFVAWASSIFNPASVGGVQLDPQTQRRPVVIYLKNEAGIRVRKWSLKDCWPTEYTPGDFDASASEVLMSQLTLANEGWVEEVLALA